MKIQVKLFLTCLFLQVVIPMMGQQDTIMVGYGETFETIANKYGITLSDLQATNPGMNKCYAGMEIVIPRPYKSPVGSSGISSPAVLYADSLLLSAKAKSAIGDYKKAIKLYNKVIDMNVRTPYAYAGRGECFFNLKKYKKAKSDLMTAISSDELAQIEKSWCKDALEDVEDELEARRQRRKQVWANIGLSVATAAAYTTAAYMASEQNRMQNQNFQSPVPSSYATGSDHLSRADQIIAQSNASINQMMARGNAQLNQMTQQTMVQAQMQKERMDQAFKEELAWRAEFAEKNGRQATEYEVDQWYGAHYPDLLQNRIMARASMNSDDSGDSNSNEMQDEYKGELSPDQYLAHYRKWEQYAEDAVRSLTSGGYTTKDNQGNIKGTSNSYYVKGVGYTGNQSRLRNCQEQMRKLRLEAAKYGVNIPQSKWETASVSY